MIAGDQERTELQGTRWKAVLLGLRLTNSFLGIRAFACFYLLWCLIGVILCFVFIPFATLGKTDAFENLLNPIALYGFVLPMALMAATIWAIKLFARLLWCGVPKPRTAMFLAMVSTAGRLAVLFAIVWLWMRGGPIGKELLLPASVACSGFAWLALVAEWKFIRTLHRHFIPAPDPAISIQESDDAVEEDTESEGVTAETKKGAFTRDLGEWFEGRFPRTHKFAVWILLPVAYVSVSSLAADGDFQAVPVAILRLAVIAPAIFQVFWIPGREVDRLIDALSQKTLQNFHGA